MKYEINIQANGETYTIPVIAYDHEEAIMRAKACLASQLEMFHEDGVCDTSNLEVV